jgi:hypothetical protein
MITHDPRWSLPRGNTLVPSRWQAAGNAAPDSRLGADWMRSSLDRIDIFISAGPSHVLATLEVYICARVGSAFERA